MLSLEAGENIFLNTFYLVGSTRTHNEYNPKLDISNDTLLSVRPVIIIKDDDLSAFPVVF
jgi:hypothetical protein